jgi:hypothetical protein
MNYQSRPLDQVELQGKILLLKNCFLSNLNALIEERLFRAIGGDGCSPFNKRQLISTENIKTGEYMAWMRSNFEGWFTEQEVEKLMNHEQFAD